MSTVLAQTRTLASDHSAPAPGQGNVRKPLEGSAWQNGLMHLTKVIKIRSMLISLVNWMSVLL
ncbi:hypothetical protein BD310DRAFT_982686 [Dichomitus squalens]|uniref:Uncharacterized protein n=1 Tax=Dichomitus squalens TaxID=114155 RepID=A0A4Q9PE68_9APHY|nr:hypothetical protein BD310DRAFT_982686 [Dichomitus squalens]